MQYLFVISGVFSALFSLLLISKKKKGIQHWFLGIMFLLITVNCFYVFNLYSQEQFYYVAFFSELNYAIPLLYGTLLWFYSKAVTLEDFRFSKKDYLHFIPFVIFFLILISPLITNINLIKSDHIGFPLIKLVITPCYLFAVLVLLSKYRMRLKDKFSFDHKIKLLWLNWITVGAVVLWLLATVGYLYNHFNINHKTLLSDYYVLSFLALYLFILAFVAFKYTDIFHKKREEETPTKFPDKDEEIELENKTIFKNEDLDNLLDVMNSKKPYLDPLLSINKLSEATHLPQYKISKILNTSLNQNFYDFINTYRVNEVKKRLEEGEADNYSILGIASDCGFNSKASFNRVFKKITGITPTEYLKSLSN
ncbi:MAG: AraC family transcriptional regulator [Saprospiraceae bacterium]|nr:helix-turn-helix domain-containing protein [Bacteroidia bacterium]NNE16403.1 AraC family transcriptional regulator [Saprospiraceae bacterium]NNL93493.1 AraC family transcriptional regulator [Saprospiraceae bacterium]